MPKKRPPRGMSNGKESPPKVRISELTEFQCRPRGVSWDRRGGGVSRDRRGLGLIVKDIIQTGLAGHSGTISSRSKWF
jgi:hypothetical protein